MTKEAQRPLSLVRSASDVLTACAERAAARFQTLLAEEHVPTEAARELMDDIVKAVHARIEDPSLGPVEAGLAADPIFDPFLDVVTDDLIASDDAVVHAESTVHVLRAIAGARARQESKPGALEPVGDLRARLRAPDAFELLVEVAHDFRSPLTSILFLAETLRDGGSGPVSELQRSQLGLIYSAAFGLASVASDVMDLARREHTLVDEEPQPYALVEVFDSVVRLVNPIVEEKGLELRVDSPGGQAHGHQHALSRVLLNLTTNALKFTDEGHVTIGAEPAAKSRLRYFVQDTGRGIPLERRAELFQPFKRRLGDNQVGHFFSGSGVGLSIARRLVLAMDSDLVLESSDGLGTRFSFEVSSAPSRRIDP